MDIVEGRNYLKNNFYSTFEELKIGTKNTDKLYDMIVGKYQEEHRKYHNLKHIYNMLLFLEKYSQQIQNNNIVNLAVWFHDIIYTTDPESQNELESAILARSNLENLGVCEEIISEVYNLILQTETHQINPKIKDSPIFLDADLSILGADEQSYGEYAQQIREEYEWIPEDIYKTKRKDILKSFLDREVLYFSQVIREILEEQARENIQKEISVLK